MYSSFGIRPVATSSREDARSIRNGKELRLRSASLCLPVEGLAGLNIHDSGFAGFDSDDSERVRL